MSKIYEYGKFIIQVWPRDHRPVHCHISIEGDTEIRVFLPDYKVEVVKGKALTSSAIKEIIEIVKDHRFAIGTEWRRLHGN